MIIKDIKQREGSRRPLPLITSHAAQRVGLAGVGAAGMKVICLQKHLLTKPSALCTVFNPPVLHWDSWAEWAGDT